MKRLTMLTALIGMLLAAPLALEAKIPLGAVAGRIDHFAFDPDRQFLVVAELGNDSVGIVDVKERKVLHRLSALREPQGTAWHPATSTLYVTNAGDEQGRDIAQVVEHHEEVLRLAVGVVVLAGEPARLRQRRPGECREHPPRPRGCPATASCAPAF